MVFLRPDVLSIKLESAKTGYFAQLCVFHMLANPPWNLMDSKVMQRIPACNKIRDMAKPTSKTNMYTHSSM